MISMIRSPSVASLAIATLFAAPCLAQERLWHSPGLENDTLGSAVDGGLDLTGDGIPDVVAAGQNAAAAKGVVGVYDGVDGALVYELLGARTEDRFGSAVALVPDLDGDGLAEILVGARFNDWKDLDAGSAYLFSGGDGSLIRAFRGQRTIEWFGSEVAVVGDLTGDGLDEIAIGAPNDWSTGKNVGGVYVYSGADGSLVRSFSGAGNNQPMFGKMIANAGDVDADGLPDLIVGAPNDDDKGSLSGTVVVFSGADGSPLKTLFGATASVAFGTRGAGVGDVNGDGHDDFLVSAPFESGVFGSEGHVVLYSGADFSVIRHHRGGSIHALLGSTLADAGDVDGDGIDEYLVTDLSDVHGVDSGAAWLYSGRTGRVLYRFDGEAAGDEVNAAHRTADYDGDGRPEVVLGYPVFDVKGSNANGAIALFRGNELHLQLDPDAANLGDTIDGQVRAAAPGARCFIAVTGVDGAPFWGPLLIDVFDANGELALAGTVPPGLSGHSFTLNAWATRTVGGPPIPSNAETIQFR